MPNFAQALKAEIVRLSRREIKAAVDPLHSSTVALKKTVAEMKKSVLALEADNKRLLALHRNDSAALPQVSPEEAEKARITSRSVRALRRKLGLTQAEFGKLVGVTGPAVLGMEKKQGSLRVRSATRGRLLALRGIGRKEARRVLEDRTD